MALRQSLVVVLACEAGILTSSCAVNSPPQSVPAPAPPAPPHLEALSTYKAPLGTTIRGFGTGFPVNSSHGRLQLVFRGEFERADGRKTPVNTATDVRSRLGGELVWDQFGPYSHPFTARGDEPGTFRGTIGTRWITADNRSIEDPEPLATTFTIEPSIVVRWFTPLTADCQGVVRRAFNFLPYELTVEAVGFVPQSFTYMISAPDAGIESTALQNTVVSGTTQSIMVVPPLIPDGMRGYALVIRIRAISTDNRPYETAFAVGVHRPIEVVYDSKPEIAEIYAPDVVSGCMHGGLTGRTIRYSEMMSQTLEKSATFEWHRQWVDAHSSSTSTSVSTTEGFSFKTGRSVTDSHSESATNAWSLSNGFSFKTKDARSGSWTVDMHSKEIATESMSMLESMLMSKGVASPVMNLCPYIPFSTKHRVVPGPANQVGANPANPTAYTPQGMVAMFSCIGVNFSLSNTTGIEDATKEEELKSTDRIRSVAEQASASLSRKLFAEQSINGSETTTDVHSVTSHEDQAIKASVSQTSMNGLVLTGQSSKGMGMTETDTVSSSQLAATAFRGVLLAGHYGVLYRQAMRLALKGNIVAYDQCGGGEIVGSVGGTTYTWAPDLAQGPQCKPLPTSGLPPYQCVISPCTGKPQ